MPEAGKVLTGFSMPYVAQYSYTAGGTVTHSNLMRLARGVSVTISPETPDDNVFYADNVAAESAPGVFAGGEATLTVDGLLIAAEKMIFGLPTPSTVTVAGESVDVYAYGDAMAIPYMSVGFVARYQSGGVVSYTPIVLTKVRFQQGEMSANTQEEEIEWQTQELTATLMRDDTAAHNWKLIGADQSTEEAAVAVIQALLTD